MEPHLLKLAIVALMFRRRLRMPRKVSPCLGAPNRMQTLCCRRRRRRHNIQLFPAPAPGDLPRAAPCILRCSHRLQQLFFHRIAQRKTDRPITVIRKEPVIPWLQRHFRRDQQSLVPRAGYLKEDLLLPLQHDLPVIGPPRQVHQPVKLHQLLTSQSHAPDLCHRLPGLFNTCSRLSRHPHILNNENPPQRSYKPRLYREANTLGSLPSSLFSSARSSQNQSQREPVDVLNRKIEKVPPVAYPRFVAPL